MFNFGKNVGLLFFFGKLYLIRCNYILICYLRTDKQKQYL